MSAMWQDWCVTVDSHQQTHQGHQTLQLMPSEALSAPLVAHASLATFPHFPFPSRTKRLSAINLAKSATLRRRRVAVLGLHILALPSALIELVDPFRKGNTHYSVH